MRKFNALTFVLLMLIARVDAQEVNKSGGI